MAPRGRSRKRNTRMDAALDALLPWGFDGKVIESTVKQLLEVYGGDDGWPFIEEGSYTLLIETILANGEAEQRNEDDVKDAGDLQNLVVSELALPADEGYGTMSLPSASGNQNLVDDANDAGDLQNLVASEHALPVDEKYGTMLLPSASGNQNLVDDVNDAGDLQNLVASEHALPVDEKYGTMLLPSASGNQNLADDVKDAGDLQNLVASEHALPADEGYGTMLLPSASGDGRSCNQTVIHKPYHGWIDDDDDGDECLVELTPGPFAQEVERLLLGKIRQNGRKIRWDVRPPDM